MRYFKDKSTFDEIATAIEQKCIPVGECDSPTSDTLF